MHQAPKAAPATLKALGLILCLLAALFSVEAKVAWFSPQGSPSATISSAKLQAADAPRLVARAIDRTSPAVYLPEIAAALMIAIIGVTMRTSNIAETENPPICPAGFYPALFFRPPPVR